jgi:hypothetical protein
MHLRNKPVLLKSRIMHLLHKPMVLRRSKPMF